MKSLLIHPDLQDLRSILLKSLITLNQVGILDCHSMTVDNSKLRVVVTPLMQTITQIEKDRCKLKHPSMDHFQSSSNSQRKTWMSTNMAFRLVMISHKSHFSKLLTTMAMSPSLIQALSSPVATQVWSKNSPKRQKPNSNLLGIYWRKKAMKKAVLKRMRTC